MHRLLTVPVLLVTSAVVAAGCKSSSEAEPVGPAADVVAGSDTVGGGFVGSSLADSLVVIVRDANSRPVPGVTVVWNATGSGTVSPVQSLTDAKGRARTSWQLGRVAGAQTAFGQVLTVDGPKSVAFRYNAVAGATASVQIAPNTATLALGETRQLAATRLDVYGNLISDRPITWASSNTAVATVNAQTGLVTAVATGTANITVTTESVTATARVSVVNASSGSDAFDTNTLSQYTQMSDIAADWSIADGVMTAQGSASSQAHLLRNGVGFANGWVEADIDRADEGGLVLRFRDTNNFILLAIRDDGSLLGHRNLELYRRVNGRIDLLAVADFQWPRGTVKTVRFEVDGTTLRGYVNGALTIQAQDPLSSGVGMLGMRYHDVPEDTTPDVARFLALRWTGF